MAVLKLIRDQSDADWKEYQLDLPVTRLGRSSPDCKNEVTFPDQAVSRRHAKIIKRADGHYLVDRESRAGTFINGRRLLPRVPHRLKDEDTIEICNYLLSYKEKAEERDQPDPDDSKRYPVEISQIGESTGYSVVLDGSSSSVLRRAKVNAETKLAAIIELTQQLRKALDLDTVLVKTLDRLLQVFSMAESVVIVLPVSEDQPKQIGLAQHRGDGTEGPTVVSGQVIADVAEQNVTALLPDKKTMCASLVGQDEKSRGVIQLNSGPSGSRFSDGDLDLFATLSTVVAFAVDNWILHGAALENHTTQAELKLATDVQMGLLPKTVPDVPGYEFYNYYSPARQVGGDYYDYLQLDEKRLVVVLGDVAGKGIPAAVLMAKVSSEINALLTCGLTPLEVMNRVNARFANRAPDGRFVTMVLAAIDLETHCVTLVNAGHMLPLLRHHDGSTVEVGKGFSGLPLGILPEYEYQESQVTLQPGDTVVLFSDGVTDASNADKLMFGMDRFRSSFERAPGTAIPTGVSIITEIHDHVGEEPQTDDTCMLCISRLV
jgi:serine phosphatase RsbU (regulator of sigma subunit)/pSer/pThr/pTyr-binding forkhead associated (FHA) protein